MRGVKVLGSRGTFFGHISSHSRAFHKIAKPPPLRPSIQHYKPFSFRMASNSAAEVKWPAKRVRETFFKFFVDENGHTFGKEALLDLIFSLGADQAGSSIFFCCTACGS